MRLGVIGCGYRISGMIQSRFRQIAPELRVVGVVDPDEEGARRRLGDGGRDARFYRGLGELVRSAKPDALAIGTRCNLHTSYAIKAARYDLPLFLEKPVSVTMRQAVALERCYENAKCPVVVSFPLRGSEMFKKAEDLIQRGAVGRPEHILARNYVNYGRIYWEHGYRDYDVTRGLFVQKATHDFDYMIHLMGAKIVRVAAMGTVGHIFGGDKPAGLTCSKCDETETCPESPQNRERTGARFAEDHPCPFSIDCGTPQTGLNEDSSSCVVEFQNGAHGVYTQVFYSLHDAGSRGATISGYDGTLSFDWCQPNLKLVKHFEPRTETVELDEGADAHFGGDAILAQNFIRLIQGREKSMTPIQDGLQSVYTCIAARESLHKGRFMNVRQVGQT